jgi:hypothetical protein
VNRSTGRGDVPDPYRSTREVAATVCSRASVIQNPVESFDLLLPRAIRQCAVAVKWPRRAQCITARCTVAATKVSTRKRFTMALTDEDISTSGTGGEGPADGGSNSGGHDGGADGTAGGEGPADGGSNPEGHDGGADGGAGEGPADGGSNAGGHDGGADGTA